MKAAIARVLGEGFRAFFLAAALYAILAVAIWMIWLGVQAEDGTMIDLPFFPAPHLWHAHEMIFGYASAAIGGFLVTAVPNWSGSGPIARNFVILAVAVWLAGRIAIWFSGALPLALVATIDLAFLPLLMTKIATQLIKRPKPQNLVFLVFLSLVWCGNLLVHLDWLGITDKTVGLGLRMGLMTLCTMIAVLGGRVTPAFTRNAMKRAGLDEGQWPKPNVMFDRLAVLLTALLPVLLLLSAQGLIIGICAIAAGCMHILRLSGWRPMWALKQPILWALHLSLLMLGIGLCLWGASQLGIGSEVASLHVLGIGAVGGMTLAVMSRAILGHTGRDLVAPGAMPLAYGLIAIAAALRWLGSTFVTEMSFPMMLASGAVWTLAFIIFIVTFWPAITGPRISSVST